MKAVNIAILGGGLSGLYAAYRLAQSGIRDFAVIEAKESLGGRILSLDVGHGAAPANRFDLGPTWFWPDYQSQLAQLVSTLGLPSFAQHESGDMLIEQGRAAPLRRRGYANVPTSMRLVGGMSALTHALAHRLDPAAIHPGTTVQRMTADTDGITVMALDANGHRSTFHAQHVLLAIAPRVAATRIDFDPPLPRTLAAAWRNTPTWMAPHAKYVAVYDTAFWREQGLSGEARSGMGPLIEIHDAGQPDGMAALFGFIGVPPAVRATLSQGVLLAQCRAQLARLFGDRAAHPVAHVIKDWSTDTFVATTEDLIGTGVHSAAPAATASSGSWQGCMTGIASEWSPQFPGYVAGAIEAASIGVRALLESEPHIAMHVHRHT